MIPQRWNPNGDGDGDGANKLDQKNGEKISAPLNIDTLPILWNVWKYIGTKEKQMLRMTCWNIKCNIEESLGMDVIVDTQHLENLPMSYPPPASAIVVRDFPPEIDLCQLLFHSGDVRSLTLDGNMIPQVLQRLLVKCQRMERLEVTTMFKCNGMDTLEEIAPGECLPTLYRLKELHFPNVLKQTGNKFYPDLEWTNIRDILTRIEMPAIEVFELKFFFNCHVEFLNSVNILYEFLEQHLSLRELELVLRQGKSCTHGHENPNSPRYHVKDIQRFPKDLRKLRAFGDCPFHEGLDKLLRHQRKLKELAYEKLDAQWSLYLIPIKNCCSTLRKLHLYFTMPPIDLSILASCQCLESLKLISCKSPTTEDKPDVLDLNHLPTTLRTIHIERYTVSSSELLYLENLPHLQSLDLRFVSALGAKNDKTGVTAQVVGAIANIPSLQDLFIEEFWSKHTDLTEISEEIKKVNAIPKGNETVIKNGIRRYAIAIASHKVIKEWRGTKMAPYIRINRFRLVDQP